MGLRKKIISLLNTQGLGVDECVCKIGDLVHAPKKPKSPNAPAGKPLGSFEIRKEAAGEGEKKYRIDAFSDGNLPISAIVALESALEGYKSEVAICDCPECEQLKARGEV